MLNGTIEVLIYAAIAVFVIIRLIATLGKDEGDSGKNIEEVIIANKQQNKNIDDGEIIQLNNDDYKEEELENKYGNSLVKQINQIKDIDVKFSVKSFLDGAGRAFEMILGAFSNNDRENLKMLLSKDMYNSFDKEMLNREKKGLKQETILVSMISSTIKKINLEKFRANICVKFISEQIHVIYDKDGNVVEGDKSEINQMEEVWTFSKDLKSKGLNWSLVKIEEA